jgi:hypothetical protein
MADEEELVDYEEEAAEEAPTGDDAGKVAAPKKGYVGIHATGFKDFLLKPEILRAIVDCGFEHPSEGACWGCLRVVGLLALSAGAMRRALARVWRNWRA